MRISEIVQSLSVDAKCTGEDPEVNAVAVNSQRVRPGDIFVAIPGDSVDGWDYVGDAIKRGAVAVVSERPSCKLDCPCQITVRDAHTALAEIAAILNGYPSRQLKVVGITGTNGKTTTAYMARKVLRAAGFEPGLIGTVAYEVGERIIQATRTTPDAVTIQNLLKQMVKTGCQSAVMEVSSHALVQGRVQACEFDVAVFTNLTQDHLDYHKTMDAYYDAKAALFRSLRSTSTAVINCDDSWGAKLLKEALPCSTISYGMQTGADVTAVNVTATIDGCTFTAKTPWGEQAVRLQLLGRHNVSNALACIASCGALGVGLDIIAESLAMLDSVRGRLELVLGKQPFSVFVDYAHTDDALRHALQSVRELTSGRVIVVFGCGGNRDTAKRPLMGMAASELADVVIVTSDNPRNEAPETIIQDILAGTKLGSAQIEAVTDRAEAIQMAIAMAGEGDCVLIAGKGHETYQDSGSRQIPFDDREIAGAALLSIPLGSGRTEKGGT